MSEAPLDPAALKKVGMIQQKQKEYFAMRLHAVGGDFTAAQIVIVANVAAKFGRGELHLSTRQGIEIHFVHHTKLDEARQILAAVGVDMGACGPRVRIIAACPGDRTCRWGVIDTKEVAGELDRKYFRQETPHKFKLAVTGCAHNCAKATENDIGIMGGIEPAWEKKDCTDCGLCINICPTAAIAKIGEDYILDPSKCINCSICTSSCPTDAWKVNKSGFILWLGGTMGKIPRLASRLPGLVETKERLDELVDRTIAYYRRNGKTKERFGRTIDRIGFEKVAEEILYGK